MHVNTHTHNVSQTKHSKGPIISQTESDGKEQQAVESMVWIGLLPGDQQLARD